MLNSITINANTFLKIMQMSVVPQCILSCMIIWYFSNVFFTIK